MKTPTTIKKEINAFILMSMQSGGMKLVDSKLQSKIATESIMKIVTPLFKKKEFSNGEIKHTTDFYWSVYEKKFGEKPLWNVRITNAVKGLLRSLPKGTLMEDRVNFIESCIYAYLYKLDDDFVADKNFPLEMMSCKLIECRKIVKEDFHYYKMSEEDYYKKYLGDKISELNLGLKKYGSDTTKNSE